MSINPSTQYPTKTAAPSASYPYGAARNITVPGDGTGTPWEAAIVNDLLGFQQALLSKAGITPTGAADTALASQYLDSIKAILGGNVSSVVFADSPKTLARVNSGLVLVDATAGNIIINLPAASILAKLEYQFARVDATTSSVTINRAGADTIDGSASYLLARDGRFKITSDGVASWLSGEVDSVQTITATANTPANGLTIAALNSTPLIFRSATASDGATSTVNTPSANLVIPSGATLGAVNAVEATYIVVEMNNAGTREFAVSNQAGGLQCDERNLISTTAIDATADSASVWYSTTARTSLPYRVIGTFTCTQATAGTWVTAVSAVQSAFGEANTVMGSLGYGQTMQAVTRNTGVTYYNTTGRAIFGYMYVIGLANYGVSLSINGGTSVKIIFSTSATNDSCGVYIIPPYASYIMNDLGSSLTRTTFELR